MMQSLFIFVCLVANYFANILGYTAVCNIYPSHILKGFLGFVAQASTRILMSYKRIIVYNKQAITVLYRFVSLKHVLKCGGFFFTRTDERKYFSAEFYCWF